LGSDKKTRQGESKAIKGWCFKELLGEQSLPNLSHNKEKIGIGILKTANTVRPKAKDLNKANWAAGVSSYNQ